MRYRFKIRKSRGRFLLLIGRDEDKGRDFSDIRTTYFSKLLPECGTDFASGESAQLALKNLKIFLAKHPLYSSINA